MSAIIHVAKRIEGVPIERAYDAWLDPAVARRFLFATPKGDLTKITIEPRVGGNFEVVERRDGEDWQHLGTFVELARPSRIAFDLEVPKAGPARTRVVIDLEGDHAGTQVALTHDGVPDGVVDRDRDGWSTVLDGLARALAS